MLVASNKSNHTPLIATYNVFTEPNWNPDNRTKTRRNELLHKNRYERERVCVWERNCVYTEFWPSAGRERRCTPVQLCPQQGHLWEDPAENTHSNTSVQGNQVYLAKDCSFTLWQADLTPNHSQETSFFISTILFSLVQKYKYCNSWYKKLHNYYGCYDKLSSRDDAWFWVLQKQDNIFKKQYIRNESHKL